MAKPQNLELFFIRDIRVRGEHLVGANAMRDDGQPNMVIVKRGEKRKVVGEVAADLVLAKSAISVVHAKPGELDEAKREIEEYQKFLQKQDQPLKKAA